MWPKNRAATMSAADMLEVGWPLPAAVVAFIEWIRNWLAMPASVSTEASLVSIIFRVAQTTGQKPKGKAHLLSTGRRCSSNALPGGAVAGGQGSMELSGAPSVHIGAYRFIIGAYQVR